MARVPEIGSTCIFNENFTFKGGTDFYYAFRYDKHAPNGGKDPVDMSNWQAYMAFARQGEVVLQSSDCVICTKDGWVAVQLDHHLTKRLDSVKEGDTIFDYEIILVTDQGDVLSFAEGECLVTDMLCTLLEEEEQ